MSQAVVVYPGITFAKMGRYTQAHGTRPNVITIECVPQPIGQIRAIGDCVFQWPGVNYILPDCKVESSQLRATTNGHIQHIKLLDRRWRWWSGGDVSGLYNIKDSDGQYVDRLKKSARELAAILLDEMQEVGYDVSALPSDQYPERSWVCSHPATELDKLCDEFGCRLVLGFHTDPVTVVRLGEGPQPPVTGHEINIDHGVNGNDLPDAFAVCGDIIEYDGVFELEPVGEDLDGSIKHIDDLSYKPVEGWINNNFRNIRVATLANNDLNEPQRRAAEQLAEKTVFRWFRPKYLTGIWEGGVGQGPPDSNTTIHTIDQFELKNYRLATAQTDYGYHIRQNVNIYGRHARMDERGLPIGTENGNALSDQVLALVPVTAVIGEDNIVRLQRKIVLLSSASTSDQVADIQTVTPTLFIRCAFNVRDYNKWMPIRWKHVVQARDEPVGTGNYVLQQPEVRYEVIINYAEQFDGLTADSDYKPILLGSYTTNKDICLAQSEDYIEGIIPRYGDTERFEILYRGLIPLTLSGRLHQLTLIADDERGHWTVAGWNSETDPYVLGYRERRRSAIIDAQERARGHRTNRLRWNRRSGRRTHE